MTRDLTLGVVFLPDFPPERLRSVAEEADHAGLPELWLWEDCFRESGVTAAAAALAWTSSLRVGIGLLPVPLRNVAVTAMEIATLERLFPGRLVAGVGHGVQEWMAQVGAKADSPMTLLREYTVALRALLDGERVTVSGRYVQLDGVQLDWPPSPTGPLLLGAVGPRSLALSGELADGTIMSGGASVVQVRATRALLDAAVEVAGRPPHRLVTFMIATTGEGAQERLDADLARWDPDGQQGLTGVAGDAETVAAAVLELSEAGADSVVLQPTSAEPDLEAFVRFAARDVAAALGPPAGPARHRS